MFEPTLPSFPAALGPAWQVLGEQLAAMGLSLPDAPLFAGQLHNRQWTVYWLIAAELPAIEVLAEHRQGQIRHYRLDVDGQSSALPAPSDPYTRSDQALWQQIQAKFAACRSPWVTEPGLGDAGVEQPAGLFSVADYTECVQQSQHTRSQRGAYQLAGQAVPASLNRQAFIEEPEAYRARLPRYRLAVCPFCYQPVIEAIDTFSLNGPGWWRCEPNGLGWFGPAYASAETQGSFLQLPQTDQASVQGCACLLAVDYGVNLQGQMPSDVSENWVWLGSPRPGLRPALLADPDVAVVMRALPIANPQGLPYVVWLASYFRRGGATGMRRLPADGGYVYDWSALAPRLWFVYQHYIEQQDTAGISALPGAAGRWCIWGRQPRPLPAGAQGRELLKLRWPVSTALPL